MSDSLFGLLFENFFCIINTAYKNRIMRVYSMEGKQEKSNFIIKVFVVIGMLAGACCMYGYIIFLSRQRSITQTMDAYMVLQNVVYMLLLLLLGYISYMVLFCHKRPVLLQKLYLVMGFVLGLIYLLCIPIKAVPDEEIHILTAYDVSDSLMGTHADTIVMRQADWDHVYNNEDLVREDFNSQYQGIFHLMNDRSLIKTHVKATQKPRYLYWFSALGITLGRLFGFSTTLTYLLGRLFNMLVFVAAVYYSIKRMPFGKGIILVWALLPMTLQQASSFSYDSPMLALSCLLTATTMSAVYATETNKKAKILNNVILVLSCLLLMPCKGFALFPLAAFPLMLLPRIYQLHEEKIQTIKDKIKPWMKIVFVGILCVCVAGFGIFLAHKVQNWLKPENVDGYFVSWAQEQGFSIGYFIKRPVALVEMLLNTLWYRSDMYLQEMLGGMLGWVDIEIPLVFNIGFLILLLYVSLRKENEKQLVKNGQRIWMGLVFLATVFLAIFAMLLYWTPRSSPVVEGMQGRYILPVLIIGLSMLRTKKNCVSENADQYAALWIAFLQVMVVTAIFRNIP